MSNQKIQALSDNFCQGAVNTALWGAATGTDGTSYPQAPIGSGNVSMTLSSPMGDGNSSLSISEIMHVGTVDCLNQGVGTLAAYDLTNSGVSAQLVSMPSGAGPNIQATFILSNNNGAAANWLGWLIYYIGGSTGWVIDAVYGNPSLNWPNNSNPSQFSYNPAIHRNLRIVEHGGTVYWDYSPDGTTWTNAASMADPFAVTGMYLSLYASTQTGTVPVQWGNVNYSLAIS